MHEIKAVIRPDRLETVLAALHEHTELPGVTVSSVHGYGRQVHGDQPSARYGETTMAKLEIVVGDQHLGAVLGAIQAAARTGRPGDGKIFVSDVREAIAIHSGAHGLAAL